MLGYDVITDFWKWYERRYSRQHGPIADLALDNCEDAFGKCEWSKFGYWYEIYRRERPRTPSLPQRHNKDSSCSFIDKEF